jgi:hypothetical protein
LSFKCSVSYVENGAAGREFCVLNVVVHTFKMVLQGDNLSSKCSGSYVQNGAAWRQFWVLNAVVHMFKMVLQGENFEF